MKPALKFGNIPKYYERRRNYRNSIPQSASCKENQNRTSSKVTIVPYTYYLNLMIILHLITIFISSVMGFPRALH